MHQETNRTPGPTAPLELRNQVTALVREAGEAATVRHLGISRLALARVVAGLPVRAGTIALVREALEPVAAE